MRLRFGTLRGLLKTRRFIGLRENRLTSVCVSSPSLAAGYFLLLAQKKVTKEKGTLAAAVTRASLPA